MRILLVHQYFLPKDQAEGNRWNRMTKVWAEMGHEVTVISGMYNLATSEKYSWCKGKLICREDYSDNINVLRAYTSESYNKNFLCRAWAYFTVMFFGLWAAVFYAKGKYDVVLATSPPLTVGPIGVLIAKAKRAPFVFEVRDLWPESAIDTGVLANPILIKILYWMERFSYKHAAFINALTPAFVDKLVKNKGIPADRVWMIPNAADLDVIQPGPVNQEIRKRHDWGDKFVALYTGAHGKANCLWQLIETAKFLRDDPRFLIVCLGSGMERDALMQKAGEEGLTNIQFLPPVSKGEVALYLNACDVTAIVLKKVDTFKTVYPNKMFDSMSAAKPIVLGIDGVARKLVVDQAHCGTFVEPENAQAIADAMRMYCENPDILKQQGQSGYEYVKANYDRRELAEKYMDLIQQGVGKPEEIGN
ncbi:MAG: glycosyltransferase family 4 protein [Planctomycetes bacterium]|nr:glycosyltransferase family 4 protein [Planctomycetota bacterium]